MTARLLPRELGVVITCNETDCSSRFQTANVRKKANRAAAARDGWIRGGGKGRRRLDYCPTCAPLERERVAKENAMREAMKATRNENRKRRAAPPASVPVGDGASP